MGDRQAARLPSADQLDRALPGRHVDVGRWRGWDRGQALANPHPADVADVRDAIVQVGDVVGCVAGGVGDLEAPAEQRLAALEDPQVLLRHRDHLPPQPVHVLACTAAARCSISRSGSSMCGAPRLWTYTSSDGQRCTSDPDAPAWSRWMWVSRSARGSQSPSASSSVGRHELGPGSISTSSSCQTPITRSRPRCMASINRIGATVPGGSGGRAVRRILLAAQVREHLGDVRVLELRRRLEHRLHVALRPARRRRGCRRGRRRGCRRRRRRGFR